MDTSTCNVKQTSSYAAMLRSMSLIIIDEASMMPLHALHAIDKLLRDLINEDIPFRGKIFLLGGDFRQVLPVMLHASRTLIVENCLKRLSLWPLFTIIKLTQNMRVQQDQQQFSKWELQLGNEQLHTVCDDDLPDSVDIPTKCIVSSDVIDTVLADLSSDLTTTVLLTPKTRHRWLY